MFGYGCHLFYCLIVCPGFLLSVLRIGVLRELYSAEPRFPYRFGRAEDFGVYALECRGDDASLHVEGGHRAETLHVGTPGYLLRHEAVVGECLPCAFPQGKFGAFADPAVVQVGDDEQPCVHPPRRCLAQPIHEQQERGGRGYGHQVVVERHGDDVRVDEQWDESGGFQTSGRVDERHVYARVVMQLLHDGIHCIPVVDAAYRHVVWGVFLPVLPDVGVPALGDGALEVAVHHDGADAFRHEVVGEGDAERRLARASLLVGECHYGRCLYHSVSCVFVMRKFTVLGVLETKCATLFSIGIFMKNRLDSVFP